MKIIKDPVYDYLEIEDKYFKLIDTAGFQRLRNIRQTTYQALYPSASHNRFVHSLGVFHLGKKAIRYFYENSKAYFPCDLNETIWNEMENSFLTACLLHDVGHSPFSHTGEEYYKKGTDIRAMLCEEIGSSQFALDSNSSIGNPHEAMSVLIGLDMCKKAGVTIDKELFARAIIGLAYSDNCKSVLTLIKNAIILMLNGKLIDVDKLDYLTRDSFVTGYKNLMIDVERLLSGYSICKDRSGEYWIVYKQRSHSVIENVIYANDQERRWIQNHPVVLYDSMLCDFAIRFFDKGMKEKQETENSSIQTAFVKEALTENGLFDRGVPVRLLCDDDIICHIKNAVDSPSIARQFFSRDTWLKPLWKTETMFTDLSDATLGMDLSKALHDDFGSILDFLQQHTGFLVNEVALDAANAAYQDAQKENGPIESIMQSYERVKYICTLFKQFQEANSLPDFEFAVVVASRFSSIYRRVDVESIKIELAGKRIVSLANYLPVMARQEDYGKPRSLFYVYTTKENIQTSESKSKNLGEEFFTYLRKHYDITSLPGYIFPVK